MLQGSLESQSDYGSSEGTRRIRPSAREHDRLSEAELPSGSEAAGTQPGSVSDYGSQVSEERGIGANALLASIPERLIQLSTASQVKCFDTAVPVYVQGSFCRSENIVSVVYGATDVGPAAVEERRKC